MSLDIHRILELLPHRYPILLVDRVLEVDPGQRIVAIKNVSINEPFFVGHFPQRPVMPGVLVIESLAQAAALLSFSAPGFERGPKTVVYLTGIDDARFRRPVEPGDQLRLEVTLERGKKGIFKYKAVGTVDGEMCAEASLMCTMREAG